MAELKIIPQKFTFSKPNITNGKGEIVSYGMNVQIELDAFKGDKKQIKEDLASIFAEVLEYFD